MYLLFFLLLFASCIFSLVTIHLLTYIVLIFRYIYDDVCFFTNLSVCCFFSIFIHMFLYACNPFFFVSHMP